MNLRFAFSHLYDSSAQSCHFCQFLQSLSIRVVILSKLSLHHLQEHKVRHAWTDMLHLHTHTHTHTLAQVVKNSVYLQLLGREWRPGPLGRFGLAVLIRGQRSFQSQSCAWTVIHKWKCSPLESSGKRKSKPFTAPQKSVSWNWGFVQTAHVT